MCYLFARYYIAHNRHAVQDYIDENQHLCNNKNRLQTWNDAELDLHHHQIIKDYDTWRYVHNGANPESYDWERLARHAAPDYNTHYTILRSYKEEIGSDNTAKNGRKRDRKKEQLKEVRERLNQLEREKHDKEKQLR